MAANFWTSSHSKLLTTKERLLATHAADRDSGLTAMQIQQIKIYMIQYIEDISKNSQHLIRQRVAATASVYFRRFYLKNDFCQYDPRMVAPACLYLAAKAEESQVQAKALFYFMKKLNTAGKYHTMPMLEMKQLLDLEMALLEELDYNLIIFNPYRNLMLFLKDAGIPDVADCAWAVINDSYKTEVSLLHPPYLVALGCLHVACVLTKKEIPRWWESLDCDLNQVFYFYEKLREPLTAEACHRYLEVVR